MGEKCCACAKEFAAADVVISFYFEQVLQGEKSGALGFYPHKNSPADSVDHVHFNHSCLEKGFSPAEFPFLYDSIVDMIRQEVYEEMEFEDCPIDIEEDPPYCLWCKRTDTVWSQQQNGFIVLTCQPCQKIWDDEDYELTWAPENGYRRVVG